MITSKKTAQKKELSFGGQRGKKKAAVKPAMDDLKSQMEDLAADKGAEQAAQFQRAAQGPKGPFVFKSKFREDVVTLVTPTKVKHADGSTFVDPGKFAEFHRNTWTTEDPLEAQMLRDKIEERKLNDPLHIVETTL